MGDMHDKMGRRDSNARRPGILGWNVTRTAQSAISSSNETDPARLKMIERQLLENQNFGLGMLAGLIAATGGAIAWGFLSLATHRQFGIMAIGLGFLVGIAIRKFGAGYDAKFGAAGAVLSLYGCIFGNLIFICMAVAKEYNLAFFNVFSKLNFELCWMLLKAGFDPRDLLFYGLALFFGYKYSIRDLTKDQMEKITA